MELLKSVKAREEGRAVTTTTIADTQKQPKQVRLLVMAASLIVIARM